MVFYLLKENTNYERKYYWGERERGQANSFQSEGNASTRQASLQGVFYYEHFYSCERMQRDRMKTEQNIVSYDVKIKPTGRWL